MIRPLFINLLIPFPFHSLYLIHAVRRCERRSSQDKPAAHRPLLGFREPHKSQSRFHPLWRCVLFPKQLEWVPYITLCFPGTHCGWTYINFLHDSSRSQLSDFLFMDSGYITREACSLPDNDFSMRKKHGEWHSNCSLELAGDLFVKLEHSFWLQMSQLSAKKRRSKPICESSSCLIPNAKYYTLEEKIGNKLIPLSNFLFSVNSGSFFDLDNFDHVAI